MSGNTLEAHYHQTFALVQHHKWSISDIEAMYPFELSIYADLLQAHLKKQEEAARNG